MYANYTIKELTEAAFAAIYDLENELDKFYIEGYHAHDPELELQTFKLDRLRKTFINSEERIEEYYKFKENLDRFYVRI